MEKGDYIFKNLRTIPVTSTQMVLAKIIVLFIFGIVFCVASTIKGACYAGIADILLRKQGG